MATPPRSPSTGDHAQLAGIEIGDSVLDPRVPNDVQRVLTFVRRHASPPAIATRPASKCSSTAAVSSTSRLKTTLDAMPDVRRTGPKQMQQDLQPMTAEIDHRSAAGHRDGCSSQARGSSGSGSKRSNAFICANDRLADLARRR